MSAAEFEPTIPGVERPQAYALDRLVIGISDILLWLFSTFNQSKMAMNMIRISLQDVRHVVRVVWNVSIVMVNNFI